jgi:hypothetical protein
MDNDKRYKPATLLIQRQHYEKSAESVAIVQRVAMNNHAIHFFPPRLI